MARDCIASRQVGLAAHTVPQQLVVDGLDVPHKHSRSGEAQSALWALV